MIDLTRFYLFAFGVVTIAGGVMGFVKANSRASIIAGSIAGALLLGAGYLASTGSRAGAVLGLVVSVALAGRFGGAFAKTRQAMPAGVMLALSIVGVVVTALALAS